MFEAAYETTFCATHRLTRRGEFLEPLHGHDWRVEAVAASDTLDEIGVVIDFEHLKKAVGEVARRFHYADINAHPDLAGQSPSAEVVARYFFDSVRALLGAGRPPAAPRPGLGSARLQRRLRPCRSRRRTRKKSRRRAKLTASYFQEDSRLHEENCLLFHPCDRSARLCRRRFRPDRHRARQGS